MFLKALGAAMVPSVIFIMLAGIIGFLLAITTPAKAGSEMGGAFVFPLFLFYGAIAGFIVYVISCIIFWSCGVSAKLFWWVTLTPNVLLLLLGICLAALAS